MCKGRKRGCQLDVQESGIRYPAGYKSIGQSVSLHWTLLSLPTIEYGKWPNVRSAEHGTQRHLQPKLRKCGTVQQHSHLSIRVRKWCVLSTGTRLRPMPVAARSKAWGWGGSLVVITGSSLGRGHGCCECRVFSGRGLWVWLITRPEESYCLCHSVWSRATVILYTYNE